MGLEEAYYNDVYREVYTEMAANNFTVFDSFVKANAVINDPKYKTIICSISGGSDSDIILDICKKVDVQKKIIYVWFDTGLEYKATKEHLKYLEKKYNIEIHREREQLSLFQLQPESTDNLFLINLSVNK